MSCPFYGKHAAPGFPLIDSGGNQCAIIVDSFAPCVMELAHYTPTAQSCPLLAHARRAYDWIREAPPETDLEKQAREIEERRT